MRSMLLNSWNRVVKTCSHTLIEATALTRFVAYTPSRKPVSLQHSLHSIRYFSSSRHLLKKNQKGKRETEDPSHNRPAKESPSTPAANPLDLTSLETELQTAIDRLKSSLSSLRPGGRFNPSSLETLRVQPDKSSKSTYPLRDLVQVVPRSGRELHLLVSDAAHVKPVSSAVLGSSLNLTTSPDPTGRNPQLLVVTVPPPTAESRKVVVDAAGKAGTVAADALRNTRAVQQKKLRKVELDRAVRSDELRKVAARMEEMVKKRKEEINKIIEAAKKALDT